MKKLTSPPPFITGAPAILMMASIFLFNTPACRKIEVLKSDAAMVFKQEAYKKGDFAFSVSNLRKITIPRSVNGSTYGEMAPSHLYVRFRPVTQAHMEAIEAGNIPTYPYPLATDSLDVSHPDYSTLYTFLPIYKTLPACPYEILDTVQLMNPESELAALAFKSAGINRVLLNTNELTGESNTNYEDTPGCDPWEDCPAPEDPVDPPPPPPPVPLQPADPRAVPFTVTYNSCSMNTDENYPSGRITVEETQWGNVGTAYEGVADIKIEILGPMGQRVVTQTNRYGCFKANNAIRGFRPLFGPRLPVIMNVIFESGRKEIRGYNDAANLSQYSLPLRHIWGNISYHMNDANVSYERNTNDQDNDCKYYVAATVNNALYEYDEYAAQDGILPPPNGLRILVHCFASSAACPMFYDLSSRYPLTAITTQSFLNVTTGGLATLALASPCDVYFGYQWRNSSDNHPNRDYTTDKIKERAYHEFAHASHYRMTSAQLWADNIQYIAYYGLGSNPYGDAGDPGVERTDLIEMWGHFLGREYAHRRYGPNRHSPILAYFNSVTTINFLNSWYAVSENRGDWTDQRFEWNHIPACFLHDLMDDDDYNRTRNPALNEANAVVDTVSGYKINTIYNYLDGSTTNPAVLMDKLRNNLPPGNTTTNFDLLRNSYGY